MPDSKNTESTDISTWMFFSRSLNRHSVVWNWLIDVCLCCPGGVVSGGQQPCSAGGDSEATETVWGETSGGAEETQRGDREATGTAESPSDITSHKPLPEEKGRWSINHAKTKAGDVSTILHINEKCICKPQEAADGRTAHNYVRNGANGRETICLIPFHWFCSCHYHDPVLSN